MSIRKLSEYTHKPRHADYLGLILSDINTGMTSAAVLSVKSNLTDLYVDMLTEQACTNNYSVVYYNLCRYFNRLKRKFYYVCH
jgi:hypothetical protein